MNSRIMSVAALLTAAALTASADFQASFNAGRQAFRQKQFDAALTGYQQAAEAAANPGQRCQAFRGMADSYMAKKDWKNAEETLTKILKDESIPATNRMSAQIGLGDCRQLQRKPAEALAAYQKALAFGIRNPQSHYAQLSCGNLLTGQKKYAEAQKCFQELLDDPKVDANRRTRAAIGLGNTLFQQGKYKEAVAALKDVVKDTKLQEALRADALTVTARAQYKLQAYKEAYASDMEVIALKNIPAYFRAAAYMQAIGIQESVTKDYVLAKKLLDEFEKMPGVNASHRKWIRNCRSRIAKTEHTI